MSPEQLVHKGSTKDVYKKGEFYLFRFSDRYSVFDWGEMPDHLTGKGEALAMFTKAVYAELERKGINHHLVIGDCRSNEILVRPFEVVRDGSSLRGKTNFFIPLEVIFRLGFAKGSSLAKRMKCEKDWLANGFDRAYQELEMFSAPMIEFTTKLERFDRPLTHAEARELSGLDHQEWEKLLDTTKLVATTLREIFDAQGIDLWDGKIELAMDEERNIVLVDSIGPDELRLTKNHVQLSKEIIRQYYRNTEWYKNLDGVKERHGERFKEFITPPAPLQKEFKTSVELLYQALANVVSGNPKGATDLNRVIAKLRSLS